MGGSLACEPAMLAGEWAGRFGKLARGKRGGWTVDSVQCTRRIHRQMKLLCCTAVKWRPADKTFAELIISQSGLWQCARCTGFHPSRGCIDGHDQQSKEKIKMTQT